MTREGRWRELSRHLAWAQEIDAQDIADHDWPSVRQDVLSALYADIEPLPSAGLDLDVLSRSDPQGSVTTSLAWNALGPEDFERLIYNLLSSAGGWENARWLTKTNAPDRGRDLSVERVVDDPLIGTTRQRVLVQCKHWLTKSIDVAEMANAVAATSHWEPPPIDVLIVATSGRFTIDAVAWTDAHNRDRKRPTLEIWPEVTSSR